MSAIVKSEPLEQPITSGILSSVAHGSQSSGRGSPKIGKRSSDAKYGQSSKKRRLASDQTNEVTLEKDAIAQVKLEEPSDAPTKIPSSSKAAAGGGHLKRPQEEVSTEDVKVKLEEQDYVIGSDSDMIYKVGLYCPCCSYVPILGIKAMKRLCRQEEDELKHLWLVTHLTANRSFPAREEMEKWKLCKQVRELTMSGCKLASSSGLASFSMLADFLSTFFACAESLSALNLDYYRSDARLLIPTPPPLTWLKLRLSSCNLADLKSLVSRSHKTLQTLSISVFSDCLTSQDLASVLTDLVSLRELCIELYLPKDSFTFINGGAEAIFSNCAQTLERLSICSEKATPMPPTVATLLCASPFRTTLKRLDVTAMNLDTCELAQLLAQHSLPQLKTISSTSFSKQRRGRTEEQLIQRDLIWSICEREGIEIIAHETYEYYIDGKLPETSPPATA